MRDDTWAWQQHRQAAQIRFATEVREVFGGVQRHFCVQIRRELRDQKTVIFGKNRDLRKLPTRPEADAQPFRFAERKLAHLPLEPEVTDPDHHLAGWDGQTEKPDKL